MKIKNVMQLLLIALSFAFLGCENVLNSDLSEMENGTSRGIVDEATAVKYNLGVGYSVTDKSFKSDPLNRSKLVTRDTNYDNSNILYHDIIEDNFTSLSSNITGIDLGLGVNIGSFSADASFKADMFNELTTAKNSVSMVVSYQHISRKLDVINAELGEEAQDYLLEIGKEAFVKKYGDRYLDTVSLGGSLDFVYTLTTSSSSNISKDKIAAALDVKFRRVFEGNFDYSNEDVSETEMSQMRETVKVFYHSQEPKVVTVKDYQDFLDLSEIFIKDLNDNDLYAVKQTFVKYTELDFDESTFYTALNAWYSTRSTVQMCYNLATAKYWEGDSEAAIAANAASEALIGIGTSIKAFNLSENIYSFPDLTLYDEFRDYLIENDAPISNDIDIPAVPNDFNGDGISDRYVFNSSNGNHYVYINNGSSTVTWRISSPSGYEGFIPHIGDFNGDKKTDILVFCVNRTDKSSQIMISNGSENGLEQFKSKLFYPAVSYHRDSAKYYSGDFNGDGKTDLIGFYKYGDGRSKIFCWYGTETGLDGYRILKSYSSTSYARDNANYQTGDFNGDGKTDLLAFYKYGGGRSKIFCWYGTETGLDGYKVLKSYSRESYNRDNGTYHTEDYNQDGKTDLIVNYKYSNTKSRIFCWYGTETGLHGYFDITK